MESVIAIFGDTHIGGSTALCTPEFYIHTDDENQKQLCRYNPIQKWLWESWTDYWNYVDLLVYQGKRKKQKRLITVILGDVMDGNHHGTHQIIQDEGDQYQVAREILQPIIDKSDLCYAVNGTESHAGSMEVALYQEFGIEYAQTLMLEVDGKIHDFAHHGRVGGRKWTSQAASIAVEVIVDCAIQKCDIPNYIWRAHCHTIDDSGNKIEGTRTISVPSWQLKSRYANKIPSAVNSRSDIGAYIVNAGILDESKSRYHGEVDNRRIIRL